MGEDSSSVVCPLERLADRLELAGGVGGRGERRTGEESSPVRRCPIMPHLPVPSTGGRHPVGSRHASGRTVVLGLHGGFRSYDALVTTRRVLGAGPQVSGPSSIRAAEADISDALPGIRLPDLLELRARGVVGSHLSGTAGTRRALGAGAANGEASQV